MCRSVVNKTVPILAAVAAVFLLLLVLWPSDEAAATATVYGWDSHGQHGDWNVPGNTGEAGLAGVPGQAAAGFAHTLVLLEDGTVQAWGDNRYGQVGAGADMSRYTAPTTLDLPPASMVAAGFRHSLVIADGDVYAFGSNVAGQLGLGHNNDTFTPTQVPLPGPADQVAAGDRFSLARLVDGRVFAWGAECDPDHVMDAEDVARRSGDAASGMSYYGDLDADPDHAADEDLCAMQDYVFVHSKVPVEMPTLAGASKMVTGFGHVVALMPDGTVLTGGCNLFGQIGQEGQELAPPRARAPFNGSVTAVDVAASTRHTLVLDDTGTVWAFGSNHAGQLGTNASLEVHALPTPIEGLPPVKQILAGHDYSIAVTEDGDAWGWGSNLAGQLPGLKKTWSIPIPSPMPDVAPETRIMPGGSHLMLY